MVAIQTENFDLKGICDSGQIFRMYGNENGVFDVFSGERHLKAVQKGNRTDFYCSVEEYELYWKHYFDLDRDYDIIIAAVKEAEGPGSDFLRRACEYGHGIRVLNQDIWEMTISFIISQQKRIPMIRRCIEALCERFGRKIYLGGADSEAFGRKLPADTGSGICKAGDDNMEEAKCGASAFGNDVQDCGAPAFGNDVPDFGSGAPALHVDEGGTYYYGFPTAQAIVQGGPEGLAGLSLGYREPYIYKTAVQYIERGLPDETVRSMGYEAAREYFKSFAGIGEKVANCICLFGAGYADAFPIDVHIKDILIREFDVTSPAGTSRVREFDAVSPAGTRQVREFDETTPVGTRRCRDDLSQSDYERLVQENFGAFSGYRGIVQQWIFACEIK